MASEAEPGMQQTHDFQRASCTSKDVSNLTTPGHRDIRQAGRLFQLPRNEDSVTGQAAHNILQGPKTTKTSYG